jgi:hypothetical protein
MERQIRARLGAARMVLAEVAGQPHHESISKVQAAAFVASITLQQLPVNTVADLATEVLDIKWHPADLQRVLAALSPDYVPAPGKRRRAMQSWEALLDYCTESDWETLLASDASSGAKMEMIIRVAVGIGLRCPTEPTIKFLTSWWLCCSSKPEDILRNITSLSECVGTVGMSDRILKFVVVAER